MTEKNKENGISLVINGGGNISVNADISFTVEDKDNSPTVHFSDALNTLVYAVLKKQEAAVLTPGEYRVLFTACTSNVTPPKDLELVPTEEVEEAVEEAVEEEVEEDAVSTA